MAENKDGGKVVGREVNGPYRQLRKCPVWVDVQKNCSLLIYKRAVVKSAQKM